MLSVKNWAGNLSFSPHTQHSPTTLEELQNCVRRARFQQQVIRPRGSTHSWNPLYATDEHYLQLDHLQGVTHVDPSLNRIRALAGTKLSRLGEEAFKHNLSMINQGDINQQSLAGATSTGTHGTGITLKSISNQITALKFVNAEGELQTSQLGDKDFDALRLSLGSMGVLYEIELQMQESYRLEEFTYAQKRELFLETIDKDVKENRHFELFYFPVGDWALIKKMNLTDSPVTQITPFNEWKQKSLEGKVYEWLNVLASKSQHYQLCDQIMQKFITPEQRVGWSHEIFPSNRDIKFMEMEYNLPSECFRDAFQEITQFIKKHRIQTLFPIEIRFVHADSLWLSPAFERESVYFAVHTYRGEDHRFYFQGIQDIFKSYQGRPHWGKWHSLRAREFNDLYPRFNDFIHLREKLDPQKTFMNSYLKEILAS